nr:MAG TPA: hypothetical protein [Bacteriophage sp.]
METLFFYSFYYFFTKKAPCGKHDASTFWRSIKNYSSTNQGVRK